MPDLNKAVIRVLADGSASFGMTKVQIDAYDAALKPNMLIKAIRGDYRNFIHVTARSVTHAAGKGVEPRDEFRRIRSGTDKAWRIYGSGVLHKDARRSRFKREELTRLEYLSRHQSTTLITHRIRPLPFGSDGVLPSAGIMVSLNDSIVNRVGRDIGTVWDRHAERSEFMANAKYYEMLDDGNLFINIEHAICALEGAEKQFTEVQAYIRWLTISSSVWVGDGNMPSRLLAYFFADVLYRFIRERAEKLGQPWNELYRVPILFYTPNTPSLDMHVLPDAQRQEDIKGVLAYYDSPLLWRRGRHEAFRLMSMFLPDPNVLFDNEFEGKPLLIYFLNYGYYSEAKEVMIRSGCGLTVADYVKKVNEEKGGALFDADSLVLSSAVFHQDVELIRAVIAAGADVNMVVSTGAFWQNRALKQAIIFSPIHIVEALMAYHPQVVYQDKKKTINLADFVHKHARGDLLPLFYDPYLKGSADTLAAFASAQNLEAVRWLLDQGEVHPVLASHPKLLSELALANNTEILSLLVNHIDDPFNGIHSKSITWALRATILSSNSRNFVSRLFQLMSAHPTNNWPSLVNRGSVTSAAVEKGNVDGLIYLLICGISGLRKLSLPEDERLRQICEIHNEMHRFIDPDSDALFVTKRFEPGVDERLCLGRALLTISEGRWPLMQYYVVHELALVYPGLSEDQQHQIAELLAPRFYFLRALFCELWAEDRQSWPWILKRVETTPRVLSKIRQEVNILKFIMLKVLAFQTMLSYSMPLVGIFAQKCDKVEEALRPWYEALQMRASEVVELPVPAGLPEPESVTNHPPSPAPALLMAPAISDSDSEGWEETKAEPVHPAYSDGV